jgi:hemerythrin-like domain-containing protein
MSRLASQMSVEKTVALFPPTRIIFESLGVNLENEGKSSLSQVACLHHIDVFDLLKKLTVGVFTTVSNDPPGGTPITLGALRKDHAHIRQILDYLEHGFLGEIYFSRQDYYAWIDLLAAELWSHMEREEGLLHEALEQVLTDEMKSYHHEHEHDEVEETVHAFRDALAGTEPGALQRAETFGIHLVDMLREHMDTEEKCVYAVVEEEPNVLCS